MQIITLYRFQRPDGGTTISPNKPETEYSETYRIVADTDKMLTKDNKTFFNVIDDDYIELYTEVTINTENII